MKDEITVIVQASSRSWQGGTDLCMNRIDGVPAVRRVAEKFLNASSHFNVIVAAPAFDEDGEFPDLFSDLVGDRLSLVFAHDADPLARMVEATKTLADDQHVVRVDGLHFAVLVAEAEKMHALSAKEAFDCVKFPDDFPVQVTSDIYRVGALRALSASDIDAAARVHPKFAMFEDTANFKTRYHTPASISDAFLAEAREQAKSVYFIPRMDVNDKALDVGNQLTFHYQLALNHLPTSGKALDIACGDGYGTRLLAAHGLDMVGGDIDAEVLVTARERAADIGNIQFRELNVMDLDIESESLDAVVSMETIEHVDDDPYLSEIYRVLKPGGVFVLSTPQNSHGHIPINAEHLREYSLKDIVALCETKFRVAREIGLKQGRVIVSGDPLGSNTMLVCQKAQ